MKSLLQKVPAWVLALGGMAGAAEEAHEGLTLDAPVLWEVPIPFWPGHSLPISNSLVMLMVAVVVITIILRVATWRMQRIPRGLQNLVEWVFEMLYQFVESLAGPRLTKRYFWYFATIFLLILTSNYLGLLPGVGEITYGGKPLLRGANADLGITLFFGCFYALLWFVWCIREQGIKHFVLHIFGPKGGIEGVLKYLLLPIFFFVGLIEVFSICLRPIILALRLYANIYAGENILEVMSAKGFLAMLPFMGLELVVGLVQALVFLMLTAIFLKTQVGDDDEHEEQPTET
ncbi:MAG: F0F1 ATP synthase subunit A [Akkermansiaceae bacterium]|nr:F0F1 ATP synthase subunit A [Akkermansiaceae bacterium]